MKICHNPKAGSPPLLSARPDFVIMPLCIFRWDDSCLFCYCECFRYSPFEIAFSFYDDHYPRLTAITFMGTYYGLRRSEITLHKLRHTCCSLLINKGWDLKKLQYWLGHSDASTTLNIYSHFNRKRLNESQNDLNSISAAAADLF
ncbi:MAG TPA: hypothetical protein DD414_12235 [Lachnospiraceae bacterium]|nr:hypothetical protein [Lachnospiraceae bacterium]